MSRRRRRSPRSQAKLWPWLLGAAAGAAAVFYALHRPARGPIPVPGEEPAAVASPVAGEKGGAPSAPPPKEELRKSDREALDRVLREHRR